MDKPEWVAPNLSRRIGRRSFLGRRAHQGALWWRASASASKLYFCCTSSAFVRSGAMLIPMLAAAPFIANCIWTACLPFRLHSFSRSISVNGHSGSLACRPLFALVGLLGVDGEMWVGGDASSRIGPTPSASHFGDTPKNAAALMRFTPPMAFDSPVTQPFTEGGLTPQAAASALCVFLGGPASASAIRSARVVFILGKPTHMK